MPLLAAAGTGPVVYDAIERRLAAFGSRPGTAKRVAVAAAAGDEAGQLGSGELGGDNGCEVNMPEECDVDNGMVDPVCRAESAPL